MRKNCASTNAQSISMQKLSYCMYFSLCKFIKHRFLEIKSCAIYWNFLLCLFFYRPFKINSTKYQNHKKRRKQIWEKIQNPVFYIFDGQKNSPFNPKWRTVPNLLHFEWNLKHKPPQATDSPHPFRGKSSPFLEYWLYLYT